MKISLSFIVRTLTIINLFLPVCTAVFYIFGYKFSLFNYSVCAVIFTVISVTVVVCSFINKERISKKSDTAMLAFLPLFSVINWIVYLFKSPDKVAVTVFMPFCFICAIILTVRFIRPVFLKISSIFIPSLALIPITFLTIILILPMFRNSVVKTIPSPEGTYYAEVTDSDQGALGGDTLVHIHTTENLDFLAFSITKIPELVFIGEWKEYETMQIEWMNDKYLVIDEILYSAE